MGEFTVSINRSSGEEEALKVKTFFLAAADQQGISILEEPELLADRFNIKVGFGGNNNELRDAIRQMKDLHAQLMPPSQTKELVATKGTIGLAPYMLL